MYPGIRPVLIVGSPPSDLFFFFFFFLFSISFFFFFFFPGFDDSLTLTLTTNTNSLEMTGPGVTSWFRPFLAADWLEVAVDKSWITRKGS